MQKILTVIMLVAWVGLSKCDDEPAAALDAAPKPPCSCILPVVLLPGGGVLPGGILNGLLAGGILNNNNINLTILKILLANPSLLKVPGILSILCNLLIAGGAPNAAPGSTSGILNNLLAGGLLNASPNLPSGNTGGILNNLAFSGIGTGLLPYLLAANPKILSDNSLLSSRSVNSAIASPGYATAYDFS